MNAISLSTYTHVYTYTYVFLRWSWKSELAFSRAGLLQIPFGTREGCRKTGEDSRTSDGWSSLDPRLERGSRAYGRSTCAGHNTSYLPEWNTSNSLTPHALIGRLLCCCGLLPKLVEIRHWKMVGEYPNRQALHRLRDIVGSPRWRHGFQVMPLNAGMLGGKCIWSAAVTGLVTGSQFETNSGRTISCFRPAWVD